MDEILRALGRFISRDLFYVASGFLISMPALAELPESVGSTYASILILVVLYPIGYLAKEIPDTLGLCSTGELKKPVGPGLLIWKLALVIWSLRRKSPWIDKYEVPDRKHMFFYYDRLTQYQRSRYDRSVFLMHVCAIMGTSFMFASISNLLYWAGEIESALVLFPLMFIFGVALLPYSFYHNMLIGKFVHDCGEKTGEEADPNLGGET